MSENSASAFRALHVPGDPFILANAWDRGSAQMLVALGAQAIGTSSAAHAFTLGRPDMGHVSRDEALTHAQDLISAVSVPVSGDFENGFGEAPDCLEDTVRLSGEVGLAGICIEDTALPEHTAYSFDLSVERIRAAASAARALPSGFFLVARADGMLTGQYGFDEALRRVKAFEQAGADGVYVPGLKTSEQVSAICQAVTVPVNVLAAGSMRTVPLQKFAELGVARISLGSMLARATHRTILDAARAMFDSGDFTALSNSASGSECDALLMAGARPPD